MTDLFSTLLEQSLTACWVIPAVLLLRFCLKKAPKRITNLLWLVVAFRLICPVSFESNVSLVTQAENLSHAAAELQDEVETLRPSQSAPTVTLPGDMVFDRPVTPVEPLWPETPSVPVLPETPEVPEIIITPEETPREQPFVSRQLVLRAGCGIWLAGVAAMALFGLLSTRQWRKRVQTAVRCEDGLWRSESVESPFILGVLRPKIYLPFVLPFGAESHVIAHEQAHLKRRDPLWKCFAFGLLAVYWFHPLVWVSYFLFCRDIELACDQQVTRNLDAEGKKAYSRALLACTVSRDPLLCPLSFGEVGVKARVKAVLQKKPSKVFTFTALVLCTVLIICCAANPKEEHPWDEAYRQTLEDLLKQYGANEDYGLQSVTTLDLWEDGVPELLVVRKVDTTDVGEGETIVYVYEYTGGEAVLRYDTPFSKTSGDTEIFWNRAEVGVRFMVFTELTDKADYPNVQKAQVITVSNPIPDDWSVSSRPYNQMEDGRWIDHGHSSGYEARILDEAEVTALFADAQSLMGLDYNGFLQKHKGIIGQGVTCYQSAFADAVDYAIDDGSCYHTVLTDMDLDGYPEMLAASGGKLWLVQYTPNEKTVVFDRTGEKHTLYAAAVPWEVGCRYGDNQRKLFTVTVLNGRPVAVIGLSADGSSERLFILEMVDGALKNWSMEASAPVGANGQRDLLYDHQINGQPVSAEEYEELAAKLVTGTLVEHDINNIPWSNSGFLNTGYLRKSGYPILEVPQPTDYPGYRKVLTDLIAHYGCYDTGDGTLPVLGLKYAALHDFGEDGSPELLTLVNHKDADQQLHMTLRIYGCDGGDTVLRYTTELGARYGQTDVSYTFTLGENFVATYHSQNEWTQEVIRITERLSQATPYTRVYRASREPSDDPPEEGTLTQFWEDGEAVTLGYYGTIMQATVDRGRHIDACWNVSPAGKTELMVFLEQMGVGTDAAPSGYGETAAEAHHSMLSGLMTVHGTTPDGIVGTTIVDLEQDGVPELLVQHGMALELYRYENSQSRLIWSGPIGVRFGQTDASYEYIITTHIDTFCIIVHDSKDAWMEEVWRVITLENGVIHEKELRAWAEADTSFLPERDNLIHFSIDGVEVPEKRYYYQLIDYIDGGMAVSAVHPYARPNSDEYMDQLLADLAAGNLPEIGDSEHRAMAWWLMATNDGQPLDEKTAMKFGAAKREFPVEPPVHCEEGSVLMWNEPHDFCRYIQKDGEDLLILACREENTQIATGTVYHVDENGYLTVMERDVVLDTFRASLVGDFDGQTLVHRRYHTDCYSGMEGCEDCFRSDLVLWNADRTEYVKLIENAPLANHFKVVSREKNIVTVTYQTGPAHSEYNEVVTGQVDLAKKTFTRLSVMPLGHTHGETAVQDGVSHQAAIGEISPQLRELFRAVLANEADFIFVPDQQTMMLQDMEHRNLFTCFTVLDMEGDGVPELIIQEEGPYYSMILRYDGGLLFGYEIPYRGMMDLKADGTYCFSSGHQDHGIGKASFTEQGMETNKLIWCQSVPTVNDVFPTKCEWFANGKPATEEELTKAYDSRAYLEDVRWYDYNDETIEQLFAPAASNPQLKQYDQVRFEKYPDGRMGERFALIRKGDYWGLADGNLEIILEPERYALEAIQLSTYEEVWPILPVQKDGCWGAIDYYGNMVIEPEWNYIQMFIYNEPKQVFVHDGEQWRSIKLTYASYTDVFTYKGLSAGEPNPELTVSDGLRAEMESIEEYLIQN